MWGGIPVIAPSECLLIDPLLRFYPPKLLPSYAVLDTGAVAETITNRPNEDGRRALAVLTQDGTPVSLRRARR